MGSIDGTVVTIATLAAVASGALAWIVATIRVRRSLGEKMRWAESRLDLAMTRNRDLQHAVQSVRVMMETLVPEQVEEAVRRIATESAGRTRLEIEDTERRLLEAMARRFAEVIGSLDALAVETARLGEVLAGDVAGTADRVQETLRQVSEGLAPRISEILEEVRRGREAVDVFQFEALGHARGLPWDDRPGRAPDTRSKR